MTAAGHEQGAQKKLKVALVQPYGFDTNNVLPLALAYLKANLDDTICDVVIIDCALQKILAESDVFRKQLLSTQADVVGVSTWSPMYGEALNVMQAAKEVLPNTITVIGGNHASTYFDQVMKNNDMIDYLFRGESEFTFNQFIHQLWDGNLQPESISGLVFRNKEGEVNSGTDIPWIQDLDSVAQPDYRAIDLMRYIEKGYKYSTLNKLNAPIWLTRGCPYRCQFCAAPLLNGRKIRTHSVKYIINLMTDLYDMGVRYFNIIDDNFTFHARYAKDVCRAIIECEFNNIEIATPNGIRLQRGDPELWALMRQAGWKKVIVAPESGSAHTLELMQKDLDLTIVPGVVKDMQQAGLIVLAFFLIGYPGERKEDLLKTRKFILDIGFDFVTFHIYQPLPGTPSFDQMVETGDLHSDFLPGDTLSADSLIFSKELAGMNVRHFLAITYILSWLHHPRMFINFIRKIGWRLPYTRFKELMVPKKPKTHTLS